MSVIPANDAPTRWRLGSGEFQFYFNDSDTAKDIPLSPGKYEDWNAYTGKTSAFPENHLSLSAGQAWLLFGIQPRR